MDMTNSSHRCPSSLRQHSNANKRSCGIDSSLATCSSVDVTFSSSAVQYSRVCGRIRGYQVSSPDTFGDSRHQSIDGYYVDGIIDGISLTHGIPRQHIWTFAAGLDEVMTRPDLNCPCTDTRSASSAAQPPAFVGNHYFCDTGASGPCHVGFLHSDDPLWLWASQHLLLF